MTILALPPFRRGGGSFMVRRGIGLMVVVAFMVIAGLIESSHMIHQVVRDRQLQQRKTYQVQATLSSGAMKTPLSIPITPAQRCRMEIENIMNEKINEWLSYKDEMPPWLDWIWDMDSYYLVNMKRNPVLDWSRKAFGAATWVWQDQYGQNFTAIRDKEFLNKYPSMFLRLEIPANASGDNKLAKEGRRRPVKLWATNVKVPVNKTLYTDETYDLRQILQCDQIEKENLPPKIEQRQQSQEQEKKPDYTLYLAACVRFRGEHHDVAPWVAYHRLIGFEHFWFYLNEAFDISDLPVSDDITYVPYNFAWDDHKNYSSSYNPESGIWEPYRLNFGGANFWQQDAQHHCLYNLKRYGVKFFVTTDLDEYIYVNSTEEDSSSRPALTNYLQEHFDNASSEIASLELKGWAYGRNLETESMFKRFPLRIDYTHRSDTPRGGREKQIYNAQVARVLWIHTTMAPRNQTRKIDVHDVHLHHYRKPHRGIFHSRGATIVNDTSIPDQYRDKMMKWIREHPSPLEVGEAMQRLSVLPSRLNLG